MKSYFFVPANNERFMQKSESLKLDEIVLDLEDGIPKVEIPSALSLIEPIKNKVNYWIRPQLNYKLKDKFLIKHLLDSGFSKFILPKVRDKIHFEEIMNQFYSRTSIKIIILVEYPKLLLDLNSILNNYNVHGLAYGMHDLANEFDVRPNYGAFLDFGKQILLMSKGHRIEYIDCPSMQISKENRKEFDFELEQMNNLGADGKIIIHPIQLDWFNSYPFYTKEDIDWAKNILFKTKAKVGNLTSNVQIINGEIVEIPHLKIAKKIIDWNETRKKLW